MAEYVEQETKCDTCTHQNACAAWIRHGETLYDDFSYSVEGCPWHQNTADVAPVVHGRWIHTTTQDDEWGTTFHHWNCSHCDYYVGSNPSGANRCPNCGARMDGE